MLMLRIGYLLFGRLGDFLRYMKVYSLPPKPETPSKLNVW